MATSTPAAVAASSWRPSRDVSAEAGRRDLLVLLALVTLGAALRVWRLGAEPLWNDEGFSWWWSQQPLADLWGAQAGIETNPPLYYTLQHLWLPLGDSEAALRSISATFRTLAIPLAYLVGRTLAGRGAGLLAAALLATSGVHLYYSQEARTYALLTAATTLAVLGLLAFLRAHDGPAPRPRAALGGLALYAFGTAVALYAHNTAVFLPLLANLVALGWWLGRAGRSRRFLLGWLAADLVTLAAWLWWLPVVLAQSRGSATLDWLAQPSPGRALHEALSLYGARYLAPGLAAACLLAPWPVLAALGVVASRDRRPAALVLATFVAGVPLLTYAAGLAGRPLWVERVLAWPLPLGLGLAAAGVVAIASPRLRAVALVALLGTQGVGLAAYYAKAKKPPFAAAAAAIAREWRPGDGVLLIPEEVSYPAAYYLRRDVPGFEALGLDPRVPGPPPYGAYQARPIGPPIAAAPLRQLTLAELGGLPGRYRRLWVLSRRVEKADPRDAVMGRLAGIGTVTERRSFRPSLALTLVEFGRADRD